MNRPQWHGAGPIPVVIVGAGPVGVAAATLLGQYGVRCLVLDRWDGVYPQPRAVHLDDEIYRILVRLGIGSQFASISRPARGLRLVDRDHRVLAVFDRDGDEGRHGHPRANMFDQPELEALLRTNLEDQPTVTLRGNVEVTDVAQGQDRVQVDFTDRLTGAQESVLATYVLGCDGANSVVRAAIGATMEDRKFEQRWLVVDVTSRVELGQWEGVHQVCDPARAATYMRIGDQRHRWEFRLLPGETATDFESIEALRPLIGPWVQGIDCEQLELVRVAEYTFRAQIADHWRAGSVFLLGDAAHLTPPFIGQGLCAGVRDAMNLSWKLAGALAGDLPAQTLDTYEVERKPHARALIRLAKLIGASMTRGGRGGDVLRGLIAPRLHSVPVLRDSVLDSETPPLRQSALLLRRPFRRGLAGRLCPNALLSDGRRLDDLGTRGFLLITTTAPSKEQRELLDKRNVRLLETDVDSPLGSWLTAGRAVSALVRPDLTVMAAGKDPSVLCDIAPTLRVNAPQPTPGTTPRAGERPPPGIEPRAAPGWTKIADHLDTACADILAFTAFPKEGDGLAGE